MKMKKLLSIALVFAMVFALILPAGSNVFAASVPGSCIFDISEGNITVSAGTNPNTLKVTYGAAQVLDNIPLANEITITNMTTQYVVVVDGVTAHITLDNANVQSNSTSAFALKNNANVTLTLSGSNILKSTANSYGGLNLGKGQTVTIQGTGSLTAAADANAAAIGKGYFDAAGGTINIISGTIFATGGSCGAGIGGTNGGNGGTINISGGTITATADSAGIGGGADAAGGSINISGGTVIAKSIGGAAGIGGGYLGAGGTINISGGTITATGGSGGAGIGGGGGDTGASGTITISNGNVTALGGKCFSSAYGGAGIGCGCNSSNGNFATVGLITIDSAATVKAASYGTNLPAIQALQGTSTAKILMSNFAALKTSNTGTEVYIKASSTLYTSFAPSCEYKSIAFTVLANDTYQLKTAGILQRYNPGLSTDFGISSNGITGYSGVEDVTSPLASFTPVTLTQTGDIVHNNVQYKTAAAVIAVLPASIAVTLVNGAIVNVPVTWADTGSYNAGTAGTYTFTATWGSMPAGADNDNNLPPPTVEVTVVQGTLGTYTATINLKKDGSIWTGSGKAITLQQASETPIATTEASGVFTANVTNGTWKILDGGADTGSTAVINNSAVSQDINYYTLNITAGSGGTVSSAGGIYVKGALVNITATPNSSYSFNGWTTSNSGSFADSSSASTIFTMPESSTIITAAFTYSGHAEPSQEPSEQPTVTGHVVDDATGNQISKFAAAVTAGSNGTYTVTMDEASALQINKPDGTKGAVADTSKIIIEASKTSAVSFSTSADGKIQLQGLGKGTECSFDVTCDLGNGQKIDIGKMEIKVDNDGNINIVNRLIDPFGKITDAYTQKPVTGVGLTLYYADTARNTANGKKPGTIVSLPNIEGFKPNNNSNPQTSDANGAFGFMVFPESDYYIVAVKDGYDKYVSPTISVEKKIVKWDFKMNKSNQINGLNRLPGENRIDTDLNIVKATFSGKVSNVILATADNYPDALAGSVLAYNLNAPILLVGRSDASQEKIFSYIKNNMDAGGTVYILGGNGAVSEQVENKLKSNGNNIIRIGGADRYETSAKIAKQLAVETGTPVVLVSGQDYPDALSISSIAAANGYPVLLVNKDGISDAVKQELMNINPERVYIIGLQGAVGKTVENEIPGVVGINSSSVIRIGGQDRFRTSAAVAKYFKLITSSVCIATGNDFPDALAGCVYAAKYNAPIILVNKTISEDAMTYFKGNNLYGITIFGGEGAVNKNIENQLSQILKH